MSKCIIRLLIIRIVILKSDITVGNLLTCWGQLVACWSGNEGCCFKAKGFLPFFRTFVTHNINPRSFGCFREQIFCFGDAPALDDMIHFVAQAICFCFKVIQQCSNTFGQSLSYFPSELDKIYSFPLLTQSKQSILFILFKWF